MNEVFHTVGLRGVGENQDLLFVKGVFKACTCTSKKQWMSENHNIPSSQSVVQNGTWLYTDKLTGSGYNQGCLSKHNLKKISFPLV